jgi:glutathione S-transferase
MVADAPGDTGIILHHYDASPFSWKVRALLGLKRLAWHSVVTPNMLPKPDLVALTGGYRRAPVLQIGADIYLDSQLALAEIERRFPGHARGAVWPVNLWADRAFFQASVVVIFGAIGDRIDTALAADREKLSGRPFDVAAMRAMERPARAEWRAHAAWIERALDAADAPFLCGDEPGIADVAAHMNIWFVAGTLPMVAEALLDGMPRVAAWRARLNDRGEGERREMTGADALAVARAAAPLAPVAHTPDPTGFVPGDRVSIAATDYGCDAIPGTLVALTPDTITIAREDAALDLLHLHAPRIGYRIAPA